MDRINQVRECKINSTQQIFFNLIQNFYFYRMIFKSLDWQCLEFSNCLDQEYFLKCFRKNFSKFYSNFLRAKVLEVFCSV